MAYQRTPRINELLFNVAIRQVQLDDDVESLSGFARTAFVLGLTDSLEHRPMRDSFAVMFHLFPHGWTGERFHRVEYRKVYAAGYDLASAQTLHQPTSRETSP